ncbi:20468_t:CDS:2, partial [Funneliformis geosporum]
MIAGYKAMDFACGLADRQDNDEVTDEVINEGNGEGSNALT